MELTVNQFSKGLQMDTHPMVLDNNTLSDALNATFVTMNSNEVILQNDMGNRKIDNAYLPAGYEPIGIKEHGGIIYIAAYNPLTNRGLVGSFPSPQRKIDTCDESYSLNLNNFIELKNNKYVIKLENITIPISGDYILHVGDKFSIYSDEITSILKYLTKLDDSKNNLFTFQIGVFNSQNEFVDISKKLKLFDISDNNDTYLYYINEVKGVDNATLNDSNLILARNKMAINTYSEKMSSPLYLRVILNHVSQVSYSITGDKTNDSGTFKIKVTYYYNCIDKINNNRFGLLFNGISCTNISTSNVEEWDLNTEKYILKLTYEVTDPNLSVHTENDEYLYTLEFPLLTDYDFGINNNATIILPSLTKTGSINVQLLHSDSVVFDGYRYFNDEENQETTLDIDIQSYPKEGSTYYVTPIIYDGTTIKKILEPIPNLDLDYTAPVNGTYTYRFYYGDDLGLPLRKLFTLKLIKSSSPIPLNASSISDANEIVDGKEGLYITTRIFNGNYLGNRTLPSNDPLNSNNNNQSIILSYYNYEYHLNIYIKDFSQIRKIVILPTLNYKLSLSKTDPITRIIGKILYDKSETSETKSYVKAINYRILNKIDLTPTVSDIEIYPDSIDTLLQLSGLPEFTVLRKINDSQLTSYVEEEVNKYNYSNDLIQYNGIVSTLNPVIKLADEIFRSSSRIELTTDVRVNNQAKGNIIQKNIPCLYSITSLHRLIKNRYYNSTYSLYIINEPHINVDWESTDFVGLAYKKGRLEDLTYREGDGLVYLGANPYLVQSNISANLCKITDNFLLLEFNTNDKIYGYPITVNLNDGYFQLGYKRVWMRVSSNEYTPFYTVSRNGESNILATYYNDDGLLNTIKKIPHYYAYTSDILSIPSKILDKRNLTWTKEFSVPLETTINVSTNITLQNNDGLFRLYNEVYNELHNSNLNLLATITIDISEGNIYSDEEFAEEIDGLNDFKINCVLLSDNESNLSGYDILLKDSDGKDFDPLYVYYKDPDNTLEPSYKKSYKADRFYVEELSTYMPELKDSSKLYHDSEGNSHDLINPAAFPIGVERNRLDSESDSDSNGTRYWGTNGSNAHSLVLHENGSGVYNPISLTFSSTKFYLDTRNIFDALTIISRKFTTTDPPSEWQNADYYNSHNY